jgi:hypothetical protein
LDGLKILIWLQNENGTIPAKHARGAFWLAAGAVIYFPGLLSALANRDKAASKGHRHNQVFSRPVAELPQKIQVV